MLDGKGNGSIGRGTMLRAPTTLHNYTVKVANRLKSKVAK